MMVEKVNNKIELPINFHVFNLRKYRILTAVAVLQDKGITVTTKAVWKQMSSIYVYKTITAAMAEMSGRQLISQVNRKKIDGCRLKYKLSAQGIRNLQSYQERHREGFDLRIRKVPQKIDWSDIPILPDWKEVENMDKYK